MKNFTEGICSRRPAEEIGMQLKCLWITSLVLFACSFCSSGFDRGKLRQEAGFKNPVATEAEIARIISLKPQIRFPIKLAIWIENSGPFNTYAEPADREILKKFGEDLKRKGIAGDVFFVSYPLVDTINLKEIRLAAARYGADAVLAIRASTQVDSYVNFLSILYPTIIGCWISPGSHRDSIFYIYGSLWDVRNEYLYLTAEAEGRAGIMRPFALIEDRDAVLLAKKKALNEFIPELKTRFYSLQGRN